MGRTDHTTKPSDRRKNKKKVQPEDGVNGVRRVRKHKPGYRAKREVKYQQKKTDLLLKKKPFKELVKRIVSNIGMDHYAIPTDIKFVRSAMEALQELSESYLLTLFMDAKADAEIHGKKRILAKNIQYVGDLKYPQISANRGWANRLKSMP